jgi:hypothetical protein
MCYFIAVMLLSLSGISKAVQDKISYHWDKSIFQGLKASWWNPEKSWENKWKWFPNSKILTYLISNQFVAITDAWHFFGLIRNISLFAAGVVLPLEWYSLLFYLVFATVFHFFFTYFFSIKKKS